MGNMNSSEEGSNDYQSEVLLNVYDLTPLNNYSYCFGFGIFHSGIQGKSGIWDANFDDKVILVQDFIGGVHGLEYGFGAHDFPASGVFEVIPKSCPGFMYRCSISLGYTSMLPSEFREFMENVASEYHGDTYHLITKNCNHFTDDMSSRLTGKGIPGWVNRLARLGVMCSCLLPESLQVTTVKQLPEYHGGSEDGSESVSTTTTREPTESDDADQDKYLLSPTTMGNGEVSFIKETYR